jgi:hypothetical protein
MTLEKTLAQLKALGNERLRAHNTKNGAGVDREPKPAFHAFLSVPRR